MKMLMVDSHCHLGSKEYVGCTDQVVQRARDAGVDYMLTVSTSTDDMQTNIDIAHSYDGIFCSIGVHPNHCSDCEDFSNIAHFFNDDKVVAVGEIGLDYFYNESTKNVQKFTLSEILEISAKSNLPYIFHARNCYPDIFDIISEFDGIQGVFHCYTDNIENAQRVLDLGFYISVSGIITFEKSNDLREVLKYIPDDRLLIETDAPYLAPVPYRGKTNEPAYVKLAARRIAEERKMLLEDLDDLVVRNFFTLFTKAKRMSL
jgi:TatD DNase family protein